MGLTVCCPQVLPMDDQSGMQGDMSDAGSGRLWCRGSISKAKHWNPLIVCGENSTHLESDSSCYHPDGSRRSGKTPFKCLFSLTTKGAQLAETRGMDSTWFR